MTSWPEILSALVAREDLTAEQTAWVMGEILDPRADGHGFAMRPAAAKSAARRHQANPRTR